MYAPDVAYVAPEQLPLAERERRVQPFAPALAIEITSPSNTFHELARKTDHYLQGGTKSVWIMDSARREIHIYAAGARARHLGADETLEDAAVLTGFSIVAGQLFEV